MMLGKKILHSSGLAALAMALAFPAVAGAQDSDTPVDRASLPDFRAEQREQMREERRAERAPRPEPQQQQQQQQQQTQRPERGNWGDGRGREAQAQPVERPVTRSGLPDFRPEQRAQMAEQRRAADADRRGDGDWQGRNGSYTDRDRNRTYTDNTGRNDGRNWRDGRDGRQYDGRRYDNRQYDGRQYDGRQYDGRQYDGRQYDNRQYDNRQWGNSSYRQDYRQWDRRWRTNNRYDWQNYRSRNRVTFSIGTYYSPYRNYRYQRLGVGYGLDSLFYSNRYWINDPWQYRLPEVYGPYRWVRYYDDVLLVDVYSGQVVDVIYDFFW